MKDTLKTFLNQLQQACQITGAEWAAVVHDFHGVWEPQLSTISKPADSDALISFLNQSDSIKWLQDIPRKKKNKMLVVGNSLSNIERIYGFSSPISESLLLVGADELDATGQRIFQMLSPGLGLFFTGDFLIEMPSFSMEQDISYQPEALYDRQLNAILQYIHSETAWLYVHEGAGFRLVASSKEKKSNIGRLYSCVDIAVLELFERDLSPIHITPGDIEDHQLLPEPPPPGAFTLIVPIAINNRTIGMMIFQDQIDYSTRDFQLSRQLARHLSSSFDRITVLADTTLRLQRLAVLNELTSAVSMGGSVEEIVAWVQKTLHKIFPGALISVLLPGSDGKTLVDFGESEEDRNSRNYVIKKSLIGYVYEMGKSILVNDASQAPRFQPLHREITSKLVVPIRIRGHVEGILALENSAESAFNRQDEVFLNLIAGQVSVLIENARLSVEAENRTRNITLISEIIQNLEGLTDLTDISQIATDLLCERLGYDLIVIFLLDEKSKELVFEGVSGEGPVDFPPQVRIASNIGVTGRVVRDNRSVFLPNVEEDSDYISFTGWTPGSLICVPLHEGNHVFGTLLVESLANNPLTINDLEALEPFAAVLSNLMMYAHRYHQLQNNIRQLNAVRETALDISTDIDLDMLMTRGVERVRALVNTPAAEMGFVDNEEKVVRLLVSDNPWETYEGSTIPFNLGVSGRIAAEGEPILVENYIQWAKENGWSGDAPFVSVAGVPLILSGEVIGTLVVMDDKPDRRFDEEDIRILQMLAPQLSIFIRNARLYQELEDRIKAQKLAESRLIQSAKLAAVGEMAASVAHELNNPLTTVTGFAELILKDWPENMDGYDDMALILEEAKRARTVVRRLLDFSRQDDILREKEDINVILGDSLALVHHVMRNRSIKMRVEFWDGLPLVRVDRNQMQQVFLNLIYNAIQAMANGGDLIVRTFVEKRENGDWLAANVQDTGSGIKQEHLEQIFEPFFTTKPSGSGTGLGLSVSYGIVSEHGGYIDVESQEGVGASFTVWLPVNTDNDTIKK